MQRHRCARHKHFNFDFKRQQPGHFAIKAKYRQQQLLTKALFCRRYESILNVLDQQEANLIISIH